MNVYLAECVGTALMILLGNGVVANTLLDKTKGHQGGWVMICAGWAFAVFTAVLCVGQFSGAHLNPAISVALVLVGKVHWQVATGYIGAQLVGAIVGAAAVFWFYHAHYLATADADLKLATFCTAPNLRSWPRNLCSEAIATFVLVYAVLLMQDPTFELPGGDPTRTIQVGLGSVGAVPVALLVFAIGLSLGGTTGYAINPARDLGPRIAHACLPITGKRDSDWSYALVPVVGPIVGALLAALFYLAASAN